MPLIELREICKTYDLGEVRVEALRGVSLDIEQGEFIALVGPSGSGKSTLMNTLGCLDRPSKGSYKLAGQEVAVLSKDELARLRNQRIGFVFQNFNLLSRTSALENVELPLVYAPNVKPAERRARAKSLLEQVGLAERLGHHSSQLSGGQQQRVAIARALVNKPAILMADEPTGNLDSRTSEEVLELFSKLNRDEKITIILVTHEMDVARHAGRVIVLRDGKVVCDTLDISQAIESLQNSRTAIKEPQE